MKGNIHIEDSDELTIDLEDDLDQIDILDDGDGEDSSLLSPRLEIEGLTTEEEIKFLKSSVTREPSHTNLPLYVKFGFDKVQSGYLDLDLNKILELRFIGCNKYILNLISDEGTIEILAPNLGDLEVERLINFIKIR